MPVQFPLPGGALTFCLGLGLGLLKTPLFRFHSLPGALFLRLTLLLAAFRLRLPSCLLPLTLFLGPAFRLFAFTLLLGTALGLLTLPLFPGATLGLGPLLLGLGATLGLTSFLFRLGTTLFLLALTFRLGTTLFFPTQGLFLTATLGLGPLPRLAPRLLLGLLPGLLRTIEGLSVHGHRLHHFHRRLLAPGRRFGAGLEVQVHPQDEEQQKVNGQHQHEQAAMLRQQGPHGISRPVQAGR